MIFKHRYVSLVILQVILAAFGASSLFAFNPPAGGDSTNTFLSPDLLGGGASVTGGAFGSALPGELAANPALGADEQRITVDASYAALVSNGNESGLGHILNLGALYPTRWGVISASLNYLTSPFDSLQLGTQGSLHGAMSKALTDKIAVGAGITGSTGDGWGLSGSLGVLYKAGTIGFMQDSRIGFALTGIGRPFTPNTVGINGGDATSYTSMFTPKLGIAGTLIKTQDIKLGASADLSTPTFQNLVLDTGLQAMFRDVITVKTGWTLNMLESVNDAQTYMPSVSVGVNLKINSPKTDSFLAKNGWAQSDITPTFAVKPLFNDVYAVGGGVNIRLGVTDVKAPLITVDYPAPVYISPNNDGIQDQLQFNVKIDDQRDIKAWSFIIEDAAGKVVRTLANKEPRAEMQDFKSFWKLVTKVKQGIPLPESLRWDGIMDSGETAPDGTYAFSISATDDNGNQATTEKYTVYVDNTVPVITVTPPAGANAMIFSPDGDGNKDSFVLAQTGSVEDLWKATVLDTTGAVVRTVESKSTAPQNFGWDGKNDGMTIVADGVYAYKVSTRDRAGNSAEASVNNIIVDTEKPSINISIDMNAFSPNGDGVKDSVTLTPSVPILTGLIGWDIAVNNRAGSTVRAYSGSGAVKPIAWDGKSDAGKAADEGDYQAVISARYINGYAPVSLSPYFNLDVTAPEAQVRAGGNIFSPVGDGKLDTVTFTQSASAEASWTGQIFAVDAAGKPAGKAVKTLSLGAEPAASVIWDGRDDSGTLAPDGNYAWRLTSTDRAGNTGFSNLAKVELNTEKAEVILQANLSAFSPNGDNVKDSIVFTAILKAATAVESYRVTVKNSSGAVVKTIDGKGKVPAAISWNGIADPAAGTATGERCPDGVYGAALEVTLVNQQTSRSAAPDFEIDTLFPTIEISAPYIVFSPNGDGKSDTLPVNQISSTEELWSATVTNERKAVVKNLNWKGAAANFVWDATDDSGNKVADGKYAYTVSSEDRAGNRVSRQLAEIKVDARTPKAYITAESPAFSPNGDGIKDFQKLSVVTNIPDGLAAWSVVIKPEGAPAGTSAAVKIWNSASATVLPAAINWDGKNTAGTVVQGKFFAELTLAYVKGDTVTAATPLFTVNALPPTLGVKLSPKYFSPDNDGIDDELFINLTAQSASAFSEWSFEIREPQGSSGNVFWKTGGTGTITEKIIWDGRSLKGELVQAATDYPFTFTVTDEVGMTSVVRGYIPIDVLIIRDGDKLKIAVPSIIFRENAADFNGLDAAVVDKNVQVLKRIAEILNKFRDYKIQVEGHANNVTGTQKEEDAELIPLSRQRADAVKAFLVQNGVDTARLSTIGMGGTRPVTARSDRENWWKNRRVEFILIK